MFWKRLLALEDIYIRRCVFLLITDFVLVASFSTFFLLIPLFASSHFLNNSSFLFLGMALFALICFLALAWLIRQIARILHVRQIFQNRRYLGQADSHSKSQIAVSATNEELNQVDKTSLIKEKQGWKIYDAIFYIMRRTRHGSYKSKEAYYTVFEARLNRAIPHLLFDAQKAKGKQFGRLYLKAQRLALGGTFEDYFETYAPQYYQIDTLSFITPEVMEAMMAMAKYDIELLNSSLLCYAPLLEEKDLAVFEAHCLHLRRHINDNLRSYKDDRLTAGKRQADVTDFGKQLLKNPYRSLPLTILFGLVSLTIFILAPLIDWEILYNQGSIFVIVLFIVLLVDMLKIKRQNSRKEALFLAGQRQLAAAKG